MSDSEERKPVSKAFTAYDVQRYRLEKLMENPEKPVVIPPRQDPKSKKQREAPDFVRNVMGSSAGAGSGEFHVYRHLRRKEFARQRMIEEEARREELDSEYQARLEKNRKEAEERVEKNRLKRLKKKQKMKGKRRKKTDDQKTENEGEDSESSDGHDCDSGSQKKETDVQGAKDGQKKETETETSRQETETEATKD